MNRVANWQVNAAEEISPLVGTPFIWGETDCASLARKMLVRMYGEDPFTGKVGNYSTKMGAVKAFKKAGSFDELIGSIGGKRIKKNSVRDGDVAVVQDDSEGFQSLLIYVGSRWIVASSENNRVESHKNLPQAYIKLYRV